MIILGLVFVGVLIFIMLVWMYLNKQAVAYIKICTVYTNKLLNKEISLDEYKEVTKKLKESVNPLLKWYISRSNYNV